MNTNTIRRRSTVFGILTAAALILTGCVTFPAPDAPPPTATAITPMPAGVQTNVPLEPPPNAESCNATESLRPPARMPAPGRMPPRSSMGEIVAHGRLIVGLDIGSNLFSFRDPMSGDIKGFDVDLAREITRAIFNDPGRVEFRVLSSAERIEALKTGAVDVVVKTMSITCERLREVSFSSPYYVASQRILALKESGITGPEKLAGKRVCSARGATSIGRIQSIQPRAHLISTTTWADCLVLLQQGQVDAVTTDDAILAGLAAQDPWVQVVGPSLGEEYYGVGIPHGKDDLVRFVNGVLERIRADGTWWRMYNQWLTVLGDSGGYGPPLVTYRD